MKVNNIILVLHTRIILLSSFVIYFFCICHLGCFPIVITPLLFCTSVVTVYVARKEPKLISSHQLHNHKKLQKTVGHLKPSKSQTFLFCRHCDYITMQKSVMWHHMQSAHNVQEILLPESDPDNFEFDSKNLGYIDQKKVFFCPEKKCCYKTHYNPVS